MAVHPIWLVTDLLKWLLSLIASLKKEYQLLPTNLM